MILRNRNNLHNRFHLIAHRLLRRLPVKRQDWLHSMAADDGAIQ